MIPKKDVFHKVLEEDVIKGEKVPIRIIILGHILHKMTDNDYVGFCGADNHSYIKYCENEGPILIYSIETGIISEIEWNSTYDDLHQVDWTADRICG